MPFITEKDVISIKINSKQQKLSKQGYLHQTCYKENPQEEMLSCTQKVCKVSSNKCTKLFILSCIQKILATKKTNKQKLHKKRCYPTHRKYAEPNQNKCTKLFILSCIQKIHKIKWIYIVIYYLMQREFFSSITTVIKLVWKLSLSSKK